MSKLYGRVLSAYKRLNQGSQDSVLTSGVMCGS